MEIQMLIRSKSASPGQKAYAYPTPPETEGKKNILPKSQTQSWSAGSSQPLVVICGRLNRPQITSQLSSAAWQNLLHATLADRLKLLMEIFSSTISSAKVSAPRAMAPTNTQQLSSDDSVSM